MPFFSPMLPRATLTWYLSLIADFLDKENAIGLIFMDFSEAFGAAPHGKLSAKMEAVEISGKPERLIRNEQEVEKKTDCISREDMTLGGYPEHSQKTGLDSVLCNISSNGFGEEDHADSMELKASLVQELALLCTKNLGKV